MVHRAQKPAKKGYMRKRSRAPKARAKKWGFSVGNGGGARPLHFAWPHMKHCKSCTKTRLKKPRLWETWQQLLRLQNITETNFICLCSTENSMRNSINKSMFFILVASLNRLPAARWNHVVTNKPFRVFHGSRNGKSRSVFPSAHPTHAFMA